MDLSEMEEFVKNFDFTDIVRRQYTCIMSKDDKKKFMKMMMSSEGHKFCSADATKMCLAFIKDKSDLLSNFENRICIAIFLEQMQYFYLEALEKRKVIKHLSQLKNKINR